MQRSSRLPDQTAFKAVDSKQIASVEIFFPIGVARLGNSVKEYFIGPELPIDNDQRGNNLPTADNKFRDSEGNIRRHRVFAYDKDGGILGEINACNNDKLTWKVYVKNSKAAGNKIRHPWGPRNPHVTQGADRKKLVVDPGAEKNSPTEPSFIQHGYVNLKGEFKRFKQPPDTITVNLGQLQLDDAGRLVFIPAEGKIHGDIFKNTEPESLDSPNCVDDACDGWVDVTVETGGKFADGNSSKGVVNKAAVLSGPPKFSWDTRSPVSLLDLIENLYNPSDAYKPEFNTHIWPVLEAPCRLSWVNDDANEAHRPSTRNRGDFLSHRQDLQDEQGDSKYKEYIFDKLRTPDDKGGDMPLLEENLFLTKLQYSRFKQWKGNMFVLESLPVYQSLEDVPLADQPKYLARANLEMSMGGSFNPGIEACDKVAKRETYLINEAFTKACNYRVDFASNNPGDFTQGLGVPWQADFKRCNGNWWPACRPFRVKPKHGVERVDWDRGAKSAKIYENWKKLGFVTKPYPQDESRFETERTL